MSRVLVADDDPLMRELMQVILRRAGHEVTLVASGTEALAEIEKGNLDLVVADIFMPEGTGLALLMSMRDQGIELPFICVSGGDGDLFRPYATIMVSLGAVAVLRKPFTPGQLLDAVIQATTREST